MDPDKERTETANSEYRLQDIADQLDHLEETVAGANARREIQRTRQMLEKIPGRKRIKKYTTRDIAEGFIGGIIFAIPLLVEGGVFEIAEFFTELFVGPIPVFLTINVLFITCITAGLLYFTDIRNVQLRLLFGFIPKRLTGALAISFLVALGTMTMWGRLHAENPTTLEQFSRVTVVWAAAALGATLGDILPGESRGEDVVKMIADIGDGGTTRTDSE